MPERRLPLLFAAALAGALCACRPADAPKEPTDTKKPTVGMQVTPAPGGEAGAANPNRRVLALR